MIEPVKTVKICGQTVHGTDVIVSILHFNGKTLKAIESTDKKAKEKVQKMVEEDEDFARSWRKNIDPQ